MYSWILLVFFISCVSSSTSGEDSSINKEEFIPTSSANECKAQGKTIAGLDLAIKLIKNAKDDYPSCTKLALPMDCENIFLSGQNKSGIYKIWPNSRLNPKSSLDVYCDMDTDGGGWTVIQRRGDFDRPKDYFFQGWKAYKDGFGNKEKDFWIGNDNIFALTNQKLCSVRFDFEDMDSVHRYAVYDTFWIDDENHSYMLHIDGYRGNAGDSMLPKHNKNEFSTKDHKRANEPSNSCALRYKGGWWYDTYTSCHSANLNGIYHKGKYESLAEGVDWSTWKGYHYSLKATEIKIRSKDFRRL